MAEKIKLFDTSKCTGCRGCQLACKQWNQLPARQTRPRGTYQNPPDLQWNTFLLMRFQEMTDGKGGVKWFYRHNACMHCTDAACVKVCPSGSSLLYRYENRRAESCKVYRLQGMHIGLSL